ncbi:MAG TPA: exosome complex RNA-binding protein Rrp4 [Candidatus Nanoarchaeia archaeon]|nr:exosome complex RNA-binding protein Rrp4 [Candidatus Nanoarchaeia archaeon]
MSEEKTIQERKVVIPGETLATGMEYLPGHGTHRVNEEIRASWLGLSEYNGSVIKVIPLKGAYIPREGDRVIGVIADVSYSSWDVNVFGPANAMLGIGDASRSYIELGEDLTRYYDIGDYIYAEVSKVSKSMFIKINMKDKMFRKLNTGLTVKISPVKVPRIIGKKGSMVNLLKEETGCTFIVGQNGIVWIKGETRQQELLALKAIKYVENNAHMSGLTDTMKEKIKEWKQNE